MKTFKINKRFAVPRDLRSNRNYAAMLDGM